MDPSNTPNSPFTPIYAQWLDSFRSLFPGGAANSSSSPAEALTPKQEQVAANQEWEDEGGSVKPVPTPEAKDAPKIPF